MTNLVATDDTTSVSAQESPPTVGTPIVGRSLHPSDEAWIDWIKRKQNDGYSFFKMDVTFNSSGDIRKELQWLEYFNGRVLYKVRKVVGFSEDVIDVVREYEFGEKYKARRNHDGRCPHHIHAIVGVPEKCSGRMLSERLKKDITSLAHVSSVHIELIPVGSADPHKTVTAAYSYMRKRKTFRPMA